MNSAPHLQTEDRAEFERVLDDVLRTAHTHPQLAEFGHRLDTERLRTLALSEATDIASHAAAEYRRFVELREEWRRPASAPGSPASAAGRPVGDSGGNAAQGPGDATEEQSGAGLAAVVAVLTPVLAGTAALIFLIVGYLLHIINPEPSLAEPMRNAGWAFATLAAAGILIACIGLLITALRNGAHPGLPAGPGGTLAEQVTDARTQWRTALVERGILPFLRTALADQTSAGTAPSAKVPHRTDGSGRTPHLGYTRPGFTSPESDGLKGTSTRPRFTSPDFTSPDYGGPEHKPE